MAAKSIFAVRVKVLAQIRAYAVTDAVKNVTCEKPEVFNPQGETHIVLMHYGCKRNIVRCLVKRGCKVTVMPAFATAEEIKADIFDAGDKIDATATSKGKGFQGAIKRHGQSRGPMAHGSKYHRHAGSNGACSDPSKVFKGKRMPGQMGGKKITVQNLEIVKVDVENNLLLVKGAVPGPKKSMVTIKETVKCGK